MAYSINDDFLNAFRNGGCFIFEGEEDEQKQTEPSTDDNGNDTEEPADDAQDEPQHEQSEQQPTQEQQAQEPKNTNVDAASNSGTVNTDTETKAEAKNSPRELAIKFDQSGLRMKIAKIALQRLGIKNGNVQLDTRKLDPFFKVALEKFVQKLDDNYTVAAITGAIRMLSDSFGKNAVQKAKEEKLAQKKAAMKQKQHAEEAKKQQPEQPAEGGSGGDEAQPQQQEQPADAGDVNAEQ